MRAGRSRWGRWSWAGGALLLVLLLAGQGVRSALGGAALAASRWLDRGSQLPMARRPVGDRTHRWLNQSCE